MMHSSVAPPNHPGNLNQDRLPLRRRGQFQETDASSDVTAELVRAGGGEFDTTNWQGQLHEAVAT